MSGPGPCHFTLPTTPIFGSRGIYGLKHDSEQCGVKYCCGDCNQRYCCSDWSYRITQEEQNHCSDSKSRRTALILGTVLGVLLPLLFCVILFVCCEAHCCVIYKCRKPVTTTIVHSPDEPSCPGQPTYPGYQPVLEI
uniref:Shisa N-terminal domain-containing protein n=1 Tax=Salarias fasciatus TaxID=181472 RepID=A0A672I929_SALFA